MSDACGRKAEGRKILDYYSMILKVQLEARHGGSYQ
jgi:hypothetical protein